MKNALTFDVEDWLQSTYDRTSPVRDVVVAQTSKVLSILDEYNTRATFFVQGLVAKKFPHLIQEISKLKHEVATHGYAHEPVYVQTPSNFASDLDRSIKLLEDITGKKVIGYRAPDFSITRSCLWALDIIEQAGILYDSSIFPIAGNRYGIANFRRYPHRLRDGGLIEFPLCTVRIAVFNVPFCGGGYLRFMPYGITKMALNYLNQCEGQPAMVYMHPYELDAEDLVNPMSKDEDFAKKWLRFTQNINRAKSESKLRNLLKDFAMAPAFEVLNIEGS